MTHRISTSEGQVVHEPDRATVTAVVDAVARSGPGGAVVLDGDAGDTPFLQACHLGVDLWRVEVWQVAPRGGEQYRVLVPGSAALSEVFWSWIDGTDDWQALNWQPVDGRPLAATG